MANDVCELLNEVGGEGVETLDDEQVMVMMDVQLVMEMQAMAVSERVVLYLAELAAGEGH